VVAGLKQNVLFHVHTTVDHKSNLFFFLLNFITAYKYLTNSLHVLIKSSYTEKEIIQGCTNGNRSRGRQRQQCFEDISDRTGLKINDATRITQDRTR